MLRRSLVLFGGAALTFGTFAGLGVTASAAPTTQTFSFTGAPETFTVPANVCQITVAALGAQGGIFGEGPAWRPASSCRSTWGVRVRPALPVVPVASTGAATAAPVLVPRAAAVARPTSGGRHMTRPADSLSRGAAVARAGRKAASPAVPAAARRVATAVPARARASAVARPAAALVARAAVPAKPATPTVSASAGPAASATGPARRPAAVEAAVSTAAAEGAATTPVAVEAAARASRPTAPA